MAAVQMVLISGALGIAAFGLVWFGWELAVSLIASLHAPKLPAAVSDKELVPDSAPPDDKVWKT